MDIVKLNIDNKPVVVQKGTTLLEAARSVGVNVPTLCHMKLHDLNVENNPGGCRICVVEVEGRRNLAPACKTECNDGMNINTHSLRVVNARRTVLELILSDHPAECLTCVKNGTCELQTMAQNLGIREIPFAGELFIDFEGTHQKIIEIQFFQSRILNGGYENILIQAGQQHIDKGGFTCAHITHQQ